MSGTHERNDSYGIRVVTKAYQSQQSRSGPVDTECLGSEAVCSFNIVATHELYEEYQAANLAY